MKQHDIVKDFKLVLFVLSQQFVVCGYLFIAFTETFQHLLNFIRKYYFKDLNCMVVKEVLGSNAEAAIRQCLRQLQLLKNVWIGVFPINVFTRYSQSL